MKVIKRDGSTVEFNKSKIRDAITKSMKNGSGILLPDIARLIANDAEKYFAKEEDVATIYKIEKYVYDRLVHYGQAETARAYEGYRAVQEFKRNTNTTDDSILELLSKKNEDEMKEKHIRRLAKGECDPRSGMIYTDMVVDLERIADHATNLVGDLDGEPKMIAN